MNFCFVPIDTDDYEEVNGKILFFDTSSIEECHNISITNDSNCERSCDFFISNLNTNAYNVELFPHNMMEIRIEDEEDCGKQHNLTVRNDCFIFTCSSTETSNSITECDIITSSLSSVVSPTSTPTTSALRPELLYGLISGIIVIILLLIAAILGIVYMYNKKRKQYNLKTTGLASNIALVTK